MSKTILMVVTSHGEIGDGHATGVWFDEFSVPYDRFRKAGFEIKVASPRGGPVPLDPKSLESNHPGPAAVAAQEALDDTIHLDEGMHHDAYAAIFFPGGHGTMFDLPENPHVQRLVAEFLENDKVVGAVCHGPACLVGAMLKDGSPAVKGRKVAAFTNSEEKAVQLDQAVPFLLQDRLAELGGEVETADDWADHVVVDGKLVTGQNPQSSKSVADAIVRLLREAG
ncbi:MULTISPECIES: type 1 glutamine amidotransferase domain-containing protein [unclassified Thioalkalivibrio]|uniref:type 1 glutamine amidotransferase domain-containing protein n=1 Tax=unclassified Thioalkalivibrio TaxID=2621013 RepID=UPI00036BDE61|nr:MULTISPECIES: type 1 glutamine amidotransferase domain-containing protein [unclassified Thioalkalivibrio]